MDVPIDLQLGLFDSLIMAILLYRCEIWGFENIPMIERIHLKYLKYILGLKQSTPTCMVLGETGRNPLSMSITCRMISYWSKLLCKKKIKLSNIIYKVIHRYNSHGVYTSPWLSEIKNILDNTGHSFIWLSQILPEKFSIVHAVKKSLQDQYVQECNTIINPLSAGDICMYKSWVKPPLWNLAGLIFKWGGIFLSFEVGNCVSNANFKWKENVK